MAAGSNARQQRLRWIDSRAGRVREPFPGGRWSVDVVSASRASGVSLRAGQRICPHETLTDAELVIGSIAESAARRHYSRHVPCRQGALPRPLTGDETALTARCGNVCPARSCRRSDVLRWSQHTAGLVPRVARKVALSSSLSAQAHPSHRSRSPRRAGCERCLPLPPPRLRRGAAVTLVCPGDGMGSGPLTQSVSNRGPIYVR